MLLLVHVYLRDPKTFNEDGVEICMSTYNKT